MNFAVIIHFLFHLFLFRFLSVAAAVFFSLFYADGVKVFCLHDSFGLARFDAARVNKVDTLQKDAKAAKDVDFSFLWKSKANTPGLFIVLACLTRRIPIRIQMYSKVC